ncbi:RluA family pseudouridine synthase [Candidatus Uhrbacteria bacterium]|jgi:23S rRNA pseudouridine1911/1915/1917 synthase|nr:RluA family pseudouridine synthase [Candidatus Uhrbacteria bacterium]
MNTENTHIIDSFDAKKRLDVWLAIQTDVSRSKIQKYIKKVGVKKNGELVSVPHNFLDEGDEVEIPKSFEIKEEDLLVKPNLEETATMKIKKEKKGKKVDFKIIFENKDVIVVNKDAGVLVHPTDSSNEETMMDAAVAYDPKIAMVGDKPEQRAGIVHRLDRMTSGVMIIARNQEAFLDLKNKFARRFVRKKYHALLNGSLDKDHEVLRFKIARSKDLGRMVARPEQQPGKEAITEFNVLERYANATEVDIDMHTGRTHQIRAHFHALGNPVVGDELYIIRKQKTIKLDRLWLHAYHLELSLPGENKASVFTAPVPRKLTKLTESLHKV